MFVKTLDSKNFLMLKRSESLAQIKSLYNFQVFLKALYLSDKDQKRRLRTGKRS